MPAEAVDMDKTAGRSEIATANVEAVLRIMVMMMVTVATVLIIIVLIVNFGLRAEPRSCFQRPSAAARLPELCMRHRP